MISRRNFLARLLSLPAAVSLAQQGGLGSADRNYLSDNDLWTFTPPVPDECFEWAEVVSEDDLQHCAEVADKLSPEHHLEICPIARRVEKARKALSSYHLAQTGA